MSTAPFHPLIQQWFASRFAAPTEPQAAGWPSIATGQHTLIAAPTGSGKTLTAFLAAIDRLFKLSLAGELDDQIRVVYLSPLRALSNDMHRNLEVPLQEIQALAEAEGLEFTPIRTGLRTGDTSASVRAQIVRKPPQILVTTPESLYLMLTGKKSRERLRHVETIIVDEIHALVRDKRGSHMALSLERLSSACERPPQRVGLSATQRPIEVTAEFLLGGAIEPVTDAESYGNGQTLLNEAVCATGLASAVSSPGLPRVHRGCTIVDVGHQRQLDLGILTPRSELGAVCSHEQWDEVNQQIIELINTHRSTIIFVNTRRLAERLTHQLSELLEEDQISSHHGSLSAEMRLTTERRLKSGELKAVVATASLELGLDVGYVDLVIQIGSPRAIATFLQRVGRSGHALGLIPKGRLFALTRDEVLEAMALLLAIRKGQLDRVWIPVAPLDILMQQIVATVAHDEWGTDALFDMLRGAYPYRHLERREFDRCLHILSEGIATDTGRSRVYIHHDLVGRRIKARKGASIAAISNGGAIPEIASFRVVAEPERTVVGTVDEDFAVESQRGDVFLLGNTSWRIQHLRGGDLVVTDAAGAPPTIPFWFGEGPGRTLELSAELSQFREELQTRIDDPAATEAWLCDTVSVTPEVAKQIVNYVAAQRAAVGLLPTQKQVIYERFFDDSGGMQLVIHAPFGSRITRAWGLAMRKRFCRSFDFELQATADDDGIILSLGPQHSFPLESMFTMLNPQNARNLLEQAVLAHPMYQTRWRWNVIRALQVLRQRNGQKVPPALLRFRSDDLLTAVFPKLTGCKEEIVGDIPLPDHPLTLQTMEDALHETLDIDGLLQVLSRIQSGEITLLGRDTREPSPFSYELLNANPYAFLDGGEVQERRTRALSLRRTLTVESVSDLGRLDPLAIQQVRQEAQPLVRDADELHDALLTRYLLPEAEGDAWRPWFEELAQAGRVAVVTLANQRRYWVPVERIPWIKLAYPAAIWERDLEVPVEIQVTANDVEARVALVRSYLDLSGPVRAADVGDLLSLSENQAFACLEALEGEGIVLRGRFTPDALPIDSTSPRIPLPPTDKDPQIEWCHRRLLARIHRLTLEGLRREIQPVNVETYLRFLTRWQGLTAANKLAGSNGLHQILAQMQGLDIPAIAWERDLLPARLDKYSPAWLDELCLTGEVVWGRLYPPKRDPEKSRPMASLSRIAPVSLCLREDLTWLSLSSPPLDAAALSGPAQDVLEALLRRGAMFAHDILAATRVLPAQLDELLGELITQGFVTADGFSGLRRLVAEKSASSGRDRLGTPRSVQRMRSRNTAVGRWSIWRFDAEPIVADDTLSPAQAQAETDRIQRDHLEQWAWQLLRRWGIVFRDLLLREQGAPKWFELVPIYRRLEARGEIRGGRFVANVAGEQFALGETVREIRQLRDLAPAQELVIVSGVDPLNLIGILTHHPRIISTASNFVAYLDGEPLAAWQGGELITFRDVPTALRPLLRARFAGHETVADGPPRTRSIPHETAPIEPPALESELAPKTRRAPRFPSSIPRPRIS